MMTEERQAASRALMKRLRQVPLSGPVVLAIETESVGELLRRVHTYESPVTVAVYFPGTDRLVLAEVT